MHADKRKTKNETGISYEVKTMKEITFFVKGDPATKGSWGKDKGGNLYPMNQGLEMWTAQVQRAAVTAMLGKEPTDKQVVIVAKIKKGEGAYIAITEMEGEKIYKKDIDKLQRALFDALTGIVYKDDSQIIMSITEKSTTPH